MLNNSLTDNSTQIGILRGEVALSIKDKERKKNQQFDSARSKSVRIQLPTKSDDGSESEYDEELKVFQKIKSVAKRDHSTNGLNLMTLAEYKKSIAKPEVDALFAKSGGMPTIKVKSVSPKPPLR